MLNGIGSLVTRPDLLDRTLIIELPRITEKKTQRNIEEVFHDRPQILGGLLDLLSKVLKTIPKIQLKGIICRGCDFTLLERRFINALGGQRVNLLTPILITENWVIREYLMNHLLRDQ